MGSPARVLFDHAYLPKGTDTVNVLALAAQRLVSIREAAAGRPLTNAQQRDYDAAIRDVITEEAPSDGSSSSRILALAQETVATAIAEGRDLTAAESTAIRHRLSQWERQRGLEARAQRAGPEHARLAGAFAPSVQVTRHESVYRPNGEHSFFRDLLSARAGDWEAADRLRRTNAEGEDIERRDGTTGSTSMGSFIPPQWIVEELAGVARAGRTLAGLIRLVGEPESNSMTVPRVTTGSATAGQTGDNAAVTEQDIVTAQLTRTTITIAGQQDVSIQSVELGHHGVDGIIYGDLEAAYQAELDREILRGSGTNELLGINQVSGINAISYTDGTPTVPELYPKLADAIQQAAVGRKLPPTFIAMHPRRWGWITAALDSQTRPLVVPNGAPGFNAAAIHVSAPAEGVVGEMQGLPVVTSSSFATNLGAGTEDQIVVAHGPSILLYESRRRARVMQEVLSGTLTLRFQLWSYVNLFAGRYPTAISTVGGTGLIAPVF
jgi:HK97 family phage major capsid protein